MGSQYKLDKPQIICLAEKCLDYQLFDCKWMPCSAKFIVLGMKPRGTGAIHMYEINEGQPELVKTVEKPNAFKCGTFDASPLSERFLATGDFEGKLQIWNLQDTYAPVYSVQGHKDAINCIDGVAGRSEGCGAPEIVTGGKDGSVKVWDPRQKDKPVAVIETAEGEKKRECWTVAFGNSYNSEERVVVGGYDNGDLKMFDLKTMSLKWETNLKNGVCGVQFDRRNIPMNKLVATTLEAKFFVFDLKTLHKEKGFAYLSEKAHKATTIWTARHLPQNRDLFVTCGGSGSLNLWQYNYPTHRTKEDGDGIPQGVPGSLTLLQETTVSSQPINSLDWSLDKLGLAVCTSFDQSVKLLITTKLNLY